MSTFTTNPILLKTLLNDIEAGRIQLPDFQRGWVWDDDHIKGLLVSISRGFPVGAIMTLSAASDIRFRKRPIEGVTVDGNAQHLFYLLDGQQRLTSLYQTLQYTGPVETRDRPGGKGIIKRWYYINIRKALNPTIDRDEIIFSVPEDRIIKTNIGRDVVLDLSSSEQEYQEHMMPAGHMMDGMAWGFKYAQYWQNRNDEHPNGDPFEYFNKFNGEILNNFANYQLPCINLGPNTPKEAVCTVFEKVNTGGVNLSTFELLTAVFAADDFSLRDDWRERHDRLHSNYPTLRDIEGEQFIQAVTLMATQEDRRRDIANGKPAEQLSAISCKKQDLLDLSLKEYKDWADRVEAGFVDAAKFLNRQFILKKDDVPYSTQLISLAALYTELGHGLEPVDAQKLLERWYWSGIFSEAYGSATESQFALDLTEVSEYIRKGTEPRLITESSFVSRTTNIPSYQKQRCVQGSLRVADETRNTGLANG